MNIQKVLSAIGAEFKGVGDTPEVTNELLSEILLTLRMLAASNDIGFQWDTFEAWVVPGSAPTRIVPVERGEIIVVKIHNYDLLNAKTIYYGQTPRGNRPDFDGLDYRVTVPPGCIIDFNEGGGALTATIAPDDYDADDFAAAIKTALEAAGSLTYTVTYLTSRKFRISATGNFALLVSSGAHTATSTAFELMGFTGADRTGASTYDGDTRKYNVYELDNNWVDKFFPLPAGESTTLVLHDSLYAISDVDTVLQVPVGIRRSRVWSIRR